MKTKTAAEQGLLNLYHYQRFNDIRLAEILGEGKIYFSKPGDFNDPWDCRPCFSKVVLDDPTEYERTVKWFTRVSRKHFPTLPDSEHERREAAIRADKSLLQKMIDEITDGMAQAIDKQYRVYCLIPQSDAPLMWSHYADSHRGVCLEFSVANALFCGSLPITYRTDYPHFNLADDDEDAALQVLLTKSEDWRYEREFRLIATAPGYTYPHIPATADSILVLPDGALKAVITGCLMSPADREVVRRLVRGSPLRPALKAAERVADQYKLVVRNV